MSQVARPSGRVVITGVGAVTPLGTGVENFWSRLIAGESGIAPITLFDVSDFPTRIAGEVKDFNAEDWLDRKEARRIDRFIAFAVASARMALDDSGLPTTEKEIGDKTPLISASRFDDDKASSRCGELTTKLPEAVLVVGQREPASLRQQTHIEGLFTDIDTDEPRRENRPWKNPCLANASSLRVQTGDGSGGCSG